MKQRILYFFTVLFFPVAVMAQTTPTSIATAPKDAKVDVTVQNATSGKMLNNEIVIFKSEANGIEYQGLTDSTGAFSLRLPFGDTYDYFVLGFHDSLESNVLKIPALRPGVFYKGTFTTINLQLTPPGSFVLEGCNFETGKATLNADSYTVLDELVAYLQRRQDDKVEISGYTDNVGKAADNLLLSQNRAYTVREYLLTKGISPDRVTAVGYGMSDPIDDNGTAEGRLHNRRIEVKTLSTD
jgi:hypothetical protein